MLRKSQIQEEIESLLQTMDNQQEFTRSWFVKTLSSKYGRPKHNYIPSDYCYNWTNKGIIYEKQPHYFIKDLYIRGLYRYVGKDYVYNGEVYSKPRK